MVVLELGALGLLLAQFITAIIFFIQANIYIGKFPSGLFNTTIFKKGLKYGMGILPHHLFVAAAPLISRSILATVKSTATLGIFSIGIKFYQPLALLQASFVMIFEPIYYGLRTNHDKKNSAKRKNFISVVWLSSIIIYTLFNLAVALLFKLIIA